MRRATLLALATALGLLVVLAAPAAAILPGQILVVPALATPSDEVKVDLNATAENPCIQWRFTGRVGNTLVINGERSQTGCPPPEQLVRVGQLDVGRYHVIAGVPGDASPLFAQVFFDVAPSPSPTPVPSEIVLAPTQPTTLDPVEVVVSSLEVWCGTLVYSSPVIDGDAIAITVDLQTFPIPIPCTFKGTSGMTFKLPPLTAGLKTLELRVSDQPYLERTFTVVAPPDHLGLGQRFAASLTWTDSAGAEHLATPVALSEDSGYFWFFARDNVEVTVKLLDGTAVNGAFWFFAASMTDVPFRIDVTWCLGPPGSGAPCRLQTYSSPGGNRNFIDTRAFGNPPS